MNDILLSIYYLSHLRRASSPNWQDPLHIHISLPPLLLTSQQFNLFSIDSVSHFQGELWQSACIQAFGA